MWCIKGPPAMATHTETVWMDLSIIIFRSFVHLVIERHARLWRCAHAHGWRDVSRMVDMTQCVLHCDVDNQGSYIGDVRVRYLAIRYPFMRFQWASCTQFITCCNWANLAVITLWNTQSYGILPILVLTIAVSTDLISWSYPSPKIRFSTKCLDTT
jgi:hypothetical protein